MTRRVGAVPLRVRLIGVGLAGWLAAELLDLRGLEHSAGYGYATSLLLAIGLYGSTYGIDLAEARTHRRVILTAVTVGVLVKAVLIGAVCYLATRDPLYLLLGVAVAQIDPLSVAAIMDDTRMSPRAKAVLASWASFDDPLTVVLAVYAAAVAIGTFGLTAAAPGAASGARDGLVAYALDLAANLAFAAVAVAAWRLLRRRPWLAGAVLALLGALAVAEFLMLGTALAGLFVRPARLGPAIGRVTTWALVVSAGLLGLLLVDGVDPLGGLLLGAMAFAAQVVAGLWLTRKLSRVDRTQLALAQQNGITAIILALRLETQYGGAVAVVAPAVLVTNTIHFASNWLADRRRRIRTGVPEPRPPREPNQRPAGGLARGRDDAMEQGRPGEVSPDTADD